MDAAIQHRFSSSRRWRRGAESALSGYLFPIASWLPCYWKKAADWSDATAGLAVVLPGIEGHSALTMGIVKGLQDAAITANVTVCDWTTGLWPLFLYHLRAQRRARRYADKLAGLIVDYQRRFPKRPVTWIGHSGGGALAVWILESLPERSQIDAALLLAPALAPSYNLAAALGTAGNLELPLMV